MRLQDIGNPSLQGIEISFPICKSYFLQVCIDSEFSDIVHFLSDFPPVFPSHVYLLIYDDARYDLPFIRRDDCRFFIFQEQAEFLQFSFHEQNDLPFIEVAAEGHVIGISRVRNIAL